MSRPRRVSSQLPTSLDPDPVQAFPSGLPSRLFIPFASPPPRSRLPRRPHASAASSPNSLVGRLGCSPPFPGEEPIASREQLFLPFRSASSSLFLSVAHGSVQTVATNAYGEGNTLWSCGPVLLLLLPGLAWCPDKLPVLSWFPTASPREIRVLWIRSYPALPFVCCLEVERS